MLKLKDFKKLKLESTFKISGGRPDGDINVTPGGRDLSNLDPLEGAGYIRSWSSDYKGVNGLEYCDEMYEYPFGPSFMV